MIEWTKIAQNVIIIFLAISAKSVTVAVTVPILLSDRKVINRQQRVGEATQEEWPKEEEQIGDCMTGNCSICGDTKGKFGCDGCNTCRVCCDCPNKQRRTTNRVRVRSPR